MPPTSLAVASSSSLEQSTMSPAATTTGRPSTSGVGVFSGPHPAAGRIARVVTMTTLAKLPLAPPPSSTCQLPMGSLPSGRSFDYADPMGNWQVLEGGGASGSLEPRMRGKDARREGNTRCIDSLRVFSESRAIVHLLGARRLSQQSYSSFPEPPKGAYL